MKGLKPPIYFTRWYIIDPYTYCFTDSLKETSQNENIISDTTPNKAYCSISSETKVKPVSIIKNTNNFQNPSKPLSAEKTNTINAKEANKNVKCMSNVTKVDCVTKKNIVSTKKTRSLQPPKKKIIIRKDIVHIDKTK